MSQKERDGFYFEVGGLMFGPFNTSGEAEAAKREIEREAMVAFEFKTAVQIFN